MSLLQLLDATLLIARFRIGRWRREVLHQRSNSDRTLTYVRSLDVGNHGIFFYNNLHEKHEVLFNFLQAGFQEGKGAIYIASEETSNQIRRRMEVFGLNVKALERDGVLRIFDYDDWYIIDGKVNASQTLVLAKSVFAEVMEIGLKGLCACGEAACFFEHKKEKELVEYELVIGRNFDLPLTVLCAYGVNHAKSLEEKFFFSLIKAHGLVVTSSFARQVKFEDVFPTIMDEILETVLGEMGKEVLLRILEERHSLTPDKIAEDPKFFIEELEELIGTGAQAIAKLLVKQMHLKMGIGKTAQSSST